ncbi:MAG: class I SAM-dependent methyltransferase [Spirochaetota bacterium]|nr:class I SAM-dependent methyltransferase [Spirochaetota bacterium]
MSILRSFLNWLKLDETKAIDNLDDPATTLTHRKIIQEKPFLRRLYVEWYDSIIKGFGGTLEGKTVVELGSGGGFFKELAPSLITSDVLDLPGVDRSFSALDMPFEAESLDGICMVDVLHHIPDVRRFLSEASRCLKPGGRVVMIEPANTIWSRFVYKNFHHEAFDPRAGWVLEDSGPLSSANGAIPWIVFKRDRKLFEREYPDLDIVEYKSHSPIRYLFSGGVSMRQLVPGSCYSVIKGAEYLLWPFNSLLGMFCTVIVRKRDSEKDGIL